MQVLPLPSSPVWEYRGGERCIWIPYFLVHLPRKYATRKRENTSLKEQLEPIFNLLCMRSAISVHYVGASFRTESCCVLMKLMKLATKIARNQVMTLEKNP